MRNSITIVDCQWYYKFSDRKFYMDEALCKGSKYIKAPYIDSIELKRNFVDSRTVKYKELFLEIEKNYQDIVMKNSIDNKEFFLSCFDEFIRLYPEVKSMWIDYANSKEKDMILEWRKANNAW